MGEVSLWDIESRVQGSGGVQGELVMLRVYVLYNSNAPGALIMVRVRDWVRDRARGRARARAIGLGLGLGL